MKDIIEIYKIAKFDMNIDNRLQISIVMKPLHVFCHTTFILET